MNCIHELTKRPFVRLCVHISLGICYLKSQFIVLASFQPNTTLASCRYGRATSTLQHLTATLTKTFSFLPFLVFWESVKCYLTSCTLVIVTVDSRTLFSLFPIYRHTLLLCYMLPLLFIDFVAIQSKMANARQQRPLAIVVKTSMEFRLLLLLYSLTEVDCK